MSVKNKKQIKNKTIKIKRQLGGAANFGSLLTYDATTIQTYFHEIDFYAKLNKSTNQKNGDDTHTIEMRGTNIEHIMEGFINVKKVQNDVDTILQQQTKLRTIPELSTFSTNAINNLYEHINNMGNLKTKETDIKYWLAFMYIHFRKLITFYVLSAKKKNTSASIWIPNKIPPALLLQNLYYSNKDPDKQYFKIATESDYSKTTIASDSSKKKTVKTKEDEIKKIDTLIMPAYDNVKKSKKSDFEADNMYNVDETPECDDECEEDDNPQQHGGGELTDAQQKELVELYDYTPELVYLLNENKDVCNITPTIFNEFITFIKDYNTFCYTFGLHQMVTDKVLFYETIQMTFKDMTDTKMPNSFTIENFTDYRNLLPQIEAISWPFFKDNLLIFLLNLKNATQYKYILMSKIDNDKTITFHIIIDIVNKLNQNAMKMLKKYLVEKFKKKNKTLGLNESNEHYSNTYNLTKFSTNDDVNNVDMWVGAIIAIMIIRKITRHNIDSNEERKILCYFYILHRYYDLNKNNKYRPDNNAPKKLIEYIFKRVIIRAIKIGTNDKLGPDVKIVIFNILRNFENIISKTSGEFNLYQHPDYTEYKNNNNIRNITLYHGKCMANKYTISDMLGITTDLEVDTKSNLPPINHIALENIHNINNTLRALLINRVCVNIMREARRMIPFINYVYFGKGYVPNNDILLIEQKDYSYLSSFSFGFNDEANIGHVLTTEDNVDPKKWALIYDNVMVSTTDNNNQSIPMNYYQKIYYV